MNHRGRVREGGYLDNEGKEERAHWTAISGDGVLEKAKHDAPVRHAAGTPHGVCKARVCLHYGRVDGLGRVGDAQAAQREALDVLREGRAGAVHGCLRENVTELHMQPRLGGRSRSDRHAWGEGRVAQHKSPVSIIPDTRCARRPWCVLLTRVAQAEQRGRNGAAGMGRAAPIPLCAVTCRCGASGAR